MSAATMNHVTLTRVLVDDLAVALNNTLSQLETLAPEPDRITSRIISHADSALSTLRHVLAETDAGQREQLRQSGGLNRNLLRRATCALECADMSDLRALPRSECLAVAVALDTWRERVTERCVAFEAKS